MFTLLLVVIKSCLRFYWLLYFRIYVTSGCYTLMFTFFLLVVILSFIVTSGCYALVFMLLVVVILYFLRFYWLLYYRVYIIIGCYTLMFTLLVVVLLSSL